MVNTCLKRDVKLLIARRAGVLRGIAGIVRIANVAYVQSRIRCARIAGVAGHSDTRCQVQGVDGEAAVTASVRPGGGVGVSADSKARNKVRACAAARTRLWAGILLLQCAAELARIHRNVIVDG